MHRTATALLLAATLLASPALAENAKPLPAKNLQWAKPGESVIIGLKDVPDGIKIGDAFALFDPSDKKITGTGKVVGTVRDGSSTGPITAWRIQVDTIKK